MGLIEAGRDFNKRFTFDKEFRDTVIEPNYLDYVNDAR